MDKKIKLKLLIPSLILPILGGGVIGYLLKNSFGIFEKLYKPIFSPPAWLFGPVWAILYLLMGYGFYLMLTSSADPRRKKPASRIFALQLGLNYLWPVLFFAMERYWAAFALAAILLPAVFAAWLRFAHISKAAGRALLPYLIWCFYALYLSAGIALLN